VTVAGISGGVERITIRSVALRDISGAYHIIPFSSVDTVTNATRGFSQAVLDINIAYREDVEAVRQAVFDAYNELKADPEFGPDMVDELQWLGINSFGENSVMVRALVKTKPGKHWGMTRAFNGIVKRLFAERGIAIALPTRTIVFGGDNKDAAALPAAEEKPKRRRPRRQPVVPPRSTDKDGEDDEKT
jgi:small conductance mechanosensitive channel